MRTFWATTIFLICCVFAQSVYAGQTSIPKCYDVKIELLKLYLERDALEEKADKNNGVLDWYDRDRYLVILRHIDAFEEILRIIGDKVCLNSEQKIPGIRSNRLNEMLISTERIPASLGRH